MKRTSTIFIRVSDEEKARLVAFAAREGLTVSAWIRRLAYIQPAIGRNEEDSNPIPVSNT